MEFLLEIGKQYGFLALVVCAIGGFFYQLYKGQAKTITDFISNERQEKGKLMDIINITLKEMSEQIQHTSRILDKVENNLNTSSNKIEKVETKIDNLSDRVNNLEIEIKTGNK